MALSAVQVALIYKSLVGVHRFRDVSESNGCHPAVSSLAEELAAGQSKFCEIFSPALAKALTAWLESKNGDTQDLPRPEAVSGFTAAVATGSSFTPVPDFAAVARELTEFIKKQQKKIHRDCLSDAS